MFHFEIVAGALVAGYFLGKLIAWLLIWFTGLGSAKHQNYWNWRWLLPSIGPYIRWLDQANPTWYYRK